ncbi:NUDIX hydrolase [Nocardia sp. NPDC004750]
MEQSVVSVDVVALRFWDEDGGVRFGIAPRVMEPFAGRLALPGVLLGRGERLAVAARRAVHTKLGVPDAAIGAVGQLVTFDEPNRDPRGPTLSIAMWAVVGPHEGPARWTGFDEVPELAFDHDRIVGVARGVLTGLLSEHPPAGRSRAVPRGREPDSRDNDRGRRDTPVSGAART